MKWRLICQVEKDYLPVPVLLDHLVVEPLLELERGISVTIDSKEYNLVGTLLSIVGDHISHCECLQITGVKSNYPSKFNLYPKENTTTKITNTFDESFQRSGTNTLQAIISGNKLKARTKTVYREDGSQDIVPRYVENSTVIRDLLYEHAGLVGMVSNGLYQSMENNELNYLHIL